PPGCPGSKAAPASTVPIRAPAMATRASRIAGARPGSCSRRSAQTADTAFASGAARSSVMSPSFALSLLFHYLYSFIGWEASGARVMEPHRTIVIGPDSGAAVEVRRGRHLRVTDVRGRQVVDMAVFNLANPREKISTSYSRSRFDPGTPGKFHPRDRLTAGDYLMSTINREMMRIVADTPEVKGMHDAHGRMCNR